MMFEKPAPSSLKAIARAFENARGPAVLCLAALLVTRCAAVPRPSVAAHGAQIEGGCVGTIDAPSELRAVDDNALLAEVLRAPDEGRLCIAETYAVLRPLRIYRVWNSSQPSSEMGRWWTLTPPNGPREAYRRDNAVCPEWSSLDQIIACDLRVGAHVALGTGQSVRCQHGVSFPASSTLQLYVPNDTRSVPQVLLVEHCTENAAWP